MQLSKRFTRLILLLLVLFPSNIYAIDVDNGKQETFSLGEIIIENLSPNGSISTGEEINIRVSASYYSSDKIEYEFSILQDQKETVIRPYNEENVCVWKPTKPGVYYLTVKAKTESGLSATTSTKVTVVNTKRLQIEKIGLNQSSGTIETGTPVTITPKVSGGTTPYQYKITVKDNNSSDDKDEASSNSVQLEWTPQHQGTYRIVVEITDAGGQIVKDEISKYNVLPNEQEIETAKKAKIAFLFFGGFFFIVLGITLIFTFNHFSRKKENR
ncbi:MAG: hypothetical protein IJH61_00825 [Eubacteriaceae bacterium]|nr:hypothetical protein [Eubacteriaceae bacterium]